MNENQQITQPQIDLAQTTPLTCKNCGHDIFVEGSKFRIISKLLVGSAQDSVLPIPVYLCASCGDILEALMPKELKGVDKKLITE